MQRRWRTPEQTRTIVVMLVAALLASLAMVALPRAPVQAQACTELVVNGGMETDAGWQLGTTAALHVFQRESVERDPIGVEDDVR